MLRMLAVKDVAGLAATCIQETLIIGEVRMADCVACLSCVVCLMPCTLKPDPLCHEAGHVAPARLNEAGDGRAATK